MKTIQNKFFNDFNNIVEDCFTILDERLERKSLLVGERKQLFEETIPQSIDKQIDAFDDNVLKNNPSPLIEEIEANLKECQTQEDKKRYLTSIILKFKRISDMLYFEKHINSELKSQESKLINQIEFRKFQINNSKEIIKMNKARTKYYEDLVCGKNIRKDKIEKIFVHFVGLWFEFANNLDALLLSYKIDLFELQDECGVWITLRRNLGSLYDKIGMENTTRNLNEIEKERQTDKPTSQPKQATFTSSNIKTIDKGKTIYEALKKEGFISTETPCNDFLFRFGLDINPDTENPIQWIKTNSTTKGKNPNKKSLLELLVLLGVPETDVKNKNLLNTIFQFSNNKPITAGNFTYITSKAGNLKTFKSEYSDLLNTIVE